MYGHRYLNFVEVSRARCTCTKLMDNMYKFIHVHVICFERVNIVSSDDNVPNTLEILDIINHIFIFISYLFHNLCI